MCWLQKWRTPLHCPVVFLLLLFWWGKTIRLWLKGTVSRDWSLSQVKHLGYRSLSVRHGLMQPLLEVLHGGWRGDTEYFLCLKKISGLKDSYLSNPWKYRHLGLQLQHPMNQKSDLYLLQGTLQNAHNCMLPKSSSMAITKWAQSCLCCPWTHWPPPPVLLPFPPTHQRKAPGILLLLFYTQDTTEMLRDFPPNLQPGMLGLAAIRTRGARCKSFCVDLTPSMCHRLLEVQDVLCVLQRLKHPVVTS